jgi:hypothetical protein
MFNNRFLLQYLGWGAGASGLPKTLILELSGRAEPSSFRISTIWACIGVSYSIQSQ